MVRTEKMKESDKKYYLKNKEKIKERVRQYELRNREKTLKRKKEYDKKYYLKNKKRMNEQMRKILKKHYREDPEFRKHALQQGKNRKRNYRFFGMKEKYIKKGSLVLPSLQLCESSSYGFIDI